MADPPERSASVAAPEQRGAPHAALRGDQRALWRSAAFLYASKLEGARVGCAPGADSVRGRSDRSAEPERPLRRRRDDQYRVNRTCGLGPAKQLLPHLPRRAIAGTRLTSSAAPVQYGEYCVVAASGRARVRLGQASEYAQVIVSRVLTQ